MNEQTVNNDVYNIEELRLLIRYLQKENRELKEKLKRAEIAFFNTNPFEEVRRESAEYDPDQGGRIISPGFITDQMAEMFISRFSGRRDVYARRGRKGGYFPQCNNRWDSDLCPKQRGEKVLCEQCYNRKWIPLDTNKVKMHLLGFKEDGSDVIGIYPLLPDGTCRLLVFDFDNHIKGSEEDDYANDNNEWRTEVDALRKMCELNGIRPLVERSRSGRGAHVWLFFMFGCKCRGLPRSPI